MAALNERLLSLLKGYDKSITYKGHDVKTTVKGARIRNNKFYISYGLSCGDRNYGEDIQIALKRKLLEKGLIKDRGNTVSPRYILIANDDEISQALDDLFLSSIKTNWKAYLRPAKAPPKDSEEPPKGSEEPPKDSEEPPKGSEEPLASDKTPVKKVETTEIPSSSSISAVPSSSTISAVPLRDKTPSISRTTTELIKDRMDGRSISSTKQKIRLGTPFGTIRIGDDPAKIQFQINKIMTDGQLTPIEKLEINLRNSKALEKLENAEPDQIDEAVEAYADEIRTIGRDILGKFGKMKMRLADKQYGRAKVASRGELLKALRGHLDTDDGRRKK